MPTRLRLLLLAAVLTGTALLATAKPAAACFFHCWHVDETTSCCELRDCSIVC
jgi:hypothetical protein